MESETHLERWMMNKFLSRFIEGNSLIYMYRKPSEERHAYLIRDEAPIWAKLLHIIYWKGWNRFKRFLITKGLVCEYCGRFGICKRRERILKHKLGETKVGGIYHKKCFKNSWEFNTEFMSGEVDTCIDCKREFYLSHKN